MLIKDETMKSIMLNYCKTEEAKSYVLGHFQRLKETVHLIPNEKSYEILDLGTYKPFAGLLTKITNHKYTYHGYGAVNSTFIDNSDGFDFLVHQFNLELHSFPFPDHSFDGVLCLEILEHLGLDPSAMLTEINRVLKPDGFLILTTPNIISARNLAKVFLGYSPLFYACFTLNKDRHNREYSFQEVQSLLEASGFETELGYTKNVYYPDQDIAKDFPFEVQQILKMAPFPELRGDCIFIRARKAGPVRQRYPKEFYDIPAKKKPSKSAAANFLNINLFSPFPPVKSGIVTYSGNLAAALEAEGVPVNQVNEHFWKHYPCQTPEKYSNRAMRMLKAGLSVVAADLFYQKPPEGPATIHHFQLSGGHHNYAILKDFYHLKGLRVVTIHDKTFRVHRFGDFYNKNEQLKVLHHSDLVIVHTQELKDELNQLGIDSQLIPHGVQVEKFDINPEKAKKYIGIDGPIVSHIGFLFGYKGIHNLIKVAPQISAKILIVGSGPDDQYLRQIAQQYAPGKVIFRPFVSENDYPYYIAASDIIAMPRLKSDGECSGVMIQAMAAGKAIIASNIGCFKEYLGSERGLLIPADDSAALAAGINCLLTDEALRQHYGNACREYAREYLGWDRVAKRHLDLYYQLIKENNRKLHGRPVEKENPRFEDYQIQMKNDWNRRCRENAKWFINTYKKDQTDAEFYQSGYHDIQCLIIPDLDLLTRDKDPKNLHLLEIGCGIGRMTRFLTEIFGHVYATDVSEEMIALAKQRIGHLPNIKFLTTNGVDFREIPDETMDLIFSAYVYQHVPSKQVIAANIEDAFRTLKPGGIFKFQTNGVDNREYQEAVKDTWVGDTFTAGEIRELSRRLGAQLLSVKGACTQYCWAILRKPIGGEKRDLIQIPEIFTFVEEEDPEGAMLILFVAGLDGELVDANNVIVNLNDRVIEPCYVGPVRKKYWEYCQNTKTSLTELTQVEIIRPADDLTDEAKVAISLMSGEVSKASSFRLQSLPLLIPKILLVANDFDGGLDIYQKGEKSKIRIFVNSLPGHFEEGDFDIVVEEFRFAPEKISFTPNNGYCMIEAQLPESIKPGRKELFLQSGELQTNHVLIDVLDSKLSSCLY